MHSHNLTHTTPNCRLVAKKGSRQLMYAAPRFSFTAFEDKPGADPDVSSNCFSLCVS